MQRGSSSLKPTEGHTWTSWRAGRVEVRGRAREGGDPRQTASGPTGTNRVIVALREEIRMDETQEKSVIKCDCKEKIGNAINQQDLLHRLFIDHGDCIVVVG
jgi:hypothetical protein